VNIILNLAWAAVALPLVGIGAAFLAETPRRAAQVGIAFTSLALGTAVVLLVFRLTHQIPDYQNVQTFWDLQVTPGASGGQSLPGEFLLTWGIRVDPLSVTFMTSALFLSVAAQLHALLSARAEEGFRRFFWVSNGLTFGLLVMIAAPTLFQFWLGWEVAGVAAWFLAAHVWRRAEVAAAATRAFVLLRVADLALLLAIVFTYSRFGGPVSQQTATNGLTTNDPFAFSALAPLWHAAHAGSVLGVGTRSLVVLAVLFIVAAVIHGAVGPLHVWLHAAADAPVAGLALVGMSAPIGAGLLLARVYPEVVEAPHVLTVLALVGAATAVTGAGFALAQRDLFRLGVFAVSSQAGMLLAALGMGGYSPAMFMLLTSSALTVLYFLCAGNIARRYRSRQLGDLGGAWKRMPRTSTGLLVWALGVSGLSLNTYTVLSATLRNTSPIGGKSSTVVEVVVAAALMVAMTLTSLYAFRGFWLVTGGDPVRRRGFDASRLREAEAPLVRAVGLAALAAAVCTLVNIPGLNYFTHFVFFGAVRQVLAVNGWALLLALALGAGGGAVAWFLFAPERRAGAARMLSRWERAGAVAGGPTPAERLMPWVSRVFVGAGSTLDSVDRQVLEPIVDSVAESGGALAALLDRVRGGRVGVALAASMAVVAVLVAASVLAITGHFPVVIR
jgi:NADH:ubiquinone oxidoreductase subunit 5 (subunit L)/multisubunit Na+/H+ antiporter MnhA subunit